MRDTFFLVWKIPFHFKNFIYGNPKFWSLQETWNCPCEGKLFCYIAYTLELVGDLTLEFPTTKSWVYSANALYHDTTLTYWLTSRWFSLPLLSVFFSILLSISTGGYDGTLLNYWLSSLNTLQWSRVGKGRKPSEIVHFVAPRLVAKCTTWFHMATSHHRF